MTMIGLEIHCQLTKLKSKLFCSCKADYRGLVSNSNLCPTCIGLPGSLPCLNKKAVESASVIALSLNCTLPEKIAFFRKNYFYPDLPKNFQITQFNAYGPTAIGHDGHILVGDHKIRIRRIQLEEDPGRLIYEGISEKTQITLVDYNRAGTPLVEIVTEPDFENPKQVRIFLNILSDLLENLDVVDPSLDGAMRADGNVSIKGGRKVEIKNINSFHDLEKALHFEITRQESLSSRDIPIIQETRHWDDKRKVTISARSKEEELEYRYFLESDIPWVVIDEDTRTKLKKNMPESVSSKKEKYIFQYNIPPQVSEVLSSDKFFSDLFEKAHDEKNAKEIANMITTDIMGLIDTKEKQSETKFTAKHLADLANAILDNTITRNQSKTTLSEIIKTGKSVSELISELNLGRVSDEGKISKIVDEVILEEHVAMKEAKVNEQILNYLVGKVMKKTQGNADPNIAIEILKKKINDF